MIYGFKQLPHWRNLVAYMLYIVSIIMKEVNVYMLAGI